MAAWKEAILYAWHGSGRKWDAMWLQLAGCGIGGLLIWYWGIKVPPEILDNPALGGLAAIVIGGLAGGAVVFLLRLGWWPVHKWLKPHGGLIALFEKRLGERMWPTMLMALGGALCVVSMGIFLAGAIWFALKLEQKPQQAAQQANSPPPPLTEDRFTNRSLI